MKKKTTPIPPSENHRIDKRRDELLDLCYKRLRELIPECGNEVNLLKCIEILERQNGETDNNNVHFSVITDTLDRLAALNR